MRLVFSSMIITALACAAALALAETASITGDWVCRINFSTIDGGGENTETFRFGADQSFEYRLRSSYYSAKQGSKKIDIGYSGSWIIDGKHLVFNRITKLDDARDDMVARWKIIELADGRMKLKPEASRERGGYERTFIRAGR